MLLRKSIYYLLIIVLVIFAPDVYASCDYNKVATAQKEASHVRVSYEFLYDDSKKVNGFQISIYNFTEDLMITLYENYISPDNKVLTTTNRDGKPIYFSETKDGTYTFKSNELDSIIKYTISIDANPSFTGCTKTLRTVELYKPKRNSYANINYCQKPGMSDYYYCKEWITQEFTVPRNQIISNIQKKLASITKTTEKTTYANVNTEISQEVESNTNLALGASIMAFLSLLIIILLLIKVKHDQKYEI